MLHPMQVYWAKLAVQQHIHCGASTVCSLHSTDWNSAIGNFSEIL